MMKISDLPLDLVGEILSRVPLTSLKAVRSTCTKWNNLSRTQILGQKTSPTKQFLGFVVHRLDLFSLRFNLRGILRDEGYSWVDPSIEKISNFHDINILQVLPCDGLLLCVINNNKKLLVWNPYLKYLKKIRMKKDYFEDYIYAFGYEDDDNNNNNNNNRNYKILRFLVEDEKGHTMIPFKFGLYDFNSSSWKSLDIKCDFDFFIENPSRGGVSLNGNTYFVAVERIIDVKVQSLIFEYFILGFDFTRERFSPRLPLPSKSTLDVVTLSSVRDEKLAMLQNHQGTMEIWISTKLEPDEISWCKFLKLEKALLLHGFPSTCEAQKFAMFSQVESFFIVEEEKKSVVVSEMNASYNKVYIRGEDGYFAYVNTEINKIPLWFTTYVPSLAKIRINKGKKRNKVAIKRKESKEIVS